MFKRHNELFLFDILVGILKIQEVAGRFSESSDLKHDFVSWDSVIREFEIIGEATRVLIDHEILDGEMRIVVDFRNQLAHHYFGIDENEVWNIIIDDLPEFKKTIIKKIMLIPDDLKSELIGYVKKECSHWTFVTDNLNFISNGEI